MISQLAETPSRRRSAPFELSGRHQTARLIMRPAELNDVDRIMEALSDFDVARMMEGASLPLLRQDALELFQSLPHNGDGGWTYALTLQDDQAIGLISLSERGGAGYDLQYWLSRSHWGKGFMGEALDALLHSVFHEMPFATINGDVYADDVPALNLQQRLGFKTTGCREIFATIRSAMVLKIQMQLTKSCFLERTNLSQ